MKKQTFQFRQNFIKASIIASICFTSVMAYAQPYNTFPTPGGHVGIGMPTTATPPNDLTLTHNTTFDNSGFSGTDFSGVKIDNNLINTSSPLTSPTPFSVFEVWNHGYTGSPATLIFDNPLLIVNATDCQGCSVVGIGKIPGSGFSGVGSLLDVSGDINADGGVITAGNVSTAGNVIAAGNVSAVGNVSAAGNVSCSVDASVGGNLSVTGVVTGTLAIADDPTTFTRPTGYRLYVQEGILTERLKVAVSTGTEWSDFVFGTGYKLTPLKELEKFIDANKHLPEIPSTSDVKKDGIDVAVMDAKLLQKVEELTLYAIQQQKEIEAQQEKYNALVKEIEELKKRK